MVTEKALPSVKHESRKLPPSRSGECQEYGYLAETDLITATCTGPKRCVLERARPKGRIPDRKVVVPLPSLNIQA